MKNTDGEALKAGFSLEGMFSFPPPFSREICSFFNHLDFSQKASEKSSSF
jgi:hypothetical protein